VLIGYATIRGLVDEYEFVTVVAPTEVWAYVLHGWLLALVMLVAAITGFGRTYEAPDGSQTKIRPEGQNSKDS
jgi:hypothetical protein